MRLAATLSVVSLVFAGCSGGAGCTACGGRGGKGGAGIGDASDDETVAQARALASPATPLPPRPEVLALAQTIEAAAVREGSGARAGDLHALSAALLERVWRVEGKEQDAKEAVEVLRAAAKDGTSPVACDAATHAARLSGELAHDARVTYAELYRAERRFLSSSPACVRTIEDALVPLAAFRPPPKVLEAIDQGLAGEGAVPLPEGGLAPVAGPPHVVQLEPLPGKEAARLVIHLDRPARFRVGDEASAGSGKPPRTFVELDGVELGAAVQHDVPVGGIVTRVVSDATSTGARIALDLDGRAYRRVFHLLEPYRVVVDIARNPPGTEHGRREVNRVTLDPGHGGSDPGAIGPTGVKEKDVTLDIVHRTAAQLAKDGLQVVLTRDDDRLVTLEERTARANVSSADLFVSVHCNAAENRARHGVETYVLDTTKDEIASRVAARENATSQAATMEIASILASMRMADQATHSTHLAELLQRTSLASVRAE